MVPIDLTSKMKEILQFLDKIPKWLKQGPWSIMAYLVIGSFAAFLIITAKDAMQSLLMNEVTFIPTNLHLQFFRFLFGIYSLSIVILVIRHSGYLPLATYTLTSWNLMTFRLIFSFLGVYFKGFGLVANLLRFPALAGCSITVIIWWIVLVPIIHSFTEGTKRAGFWKFNRSPLLINVHFLNLPLVATEFLLSGIYLRFHDLWLGLLVALLYVCFYLTILDPAGYHFYVILSPRTVFCVVPYIIILALYYGLYLGWNKVLALM